MKLTIVHECPAIDRLAAAVEKLVAHRTAPPPEVLPAPAEPKNAEIEAFDEALDALHLEEAHHRHVKNALRVVMGRRACPPPFTKPVLRSEIMELGLPIPAGY